MQELFELTPIWLSNLITVGFGLLVGSFLNVVVARVPAGRSVVSPRSCCAHCGALIRWHDNVPVLSYLLLRGRCRACGGTISVRYPVIELLTAFLFLAARVKFGWGPLLFLHDWPFLALLVAITFIDLEHRLIPDVLSLPGIALGVLTAWWVPGLGLVPSLIGAGGGFAIFYAFAWIYYRATGRSGLGGGDIKLLAMIGAFLGPAGVFGTMLVSSVFGSLVGISLALARRERSVMKASIPYGPFLVIGALWQYLFGDILAWLPFTIPT